MEIESITELLAPVLRLSPRFALAIAVSLVVYSVYRLSSGKSGRFQYHVSAERKSSRMKRPEEVSTLPNYPTVEPLPDFRWEEKEPLQLRPFKPKYHLTMALTNIDASRLLEMDNTYRSRIDLRRQIMHQHPGTVLGANDCIKSAVDELYTWMFGTYLPTRFPLMFAMDSEASPATMLRNLVTSEKIPLEPPTAPLEALHTLGSHIDEDFLFLLPSSDQSDTYTLQGFVNCFPNGFDSSKKIGMKLADIHGPVPGYKEKLEKSMDRFFSKLEVGKFVARANWGITLNDQLFSAFNDQHGYDGDSGEAQKIDLSQHHSELNNMIVNPQVYIRSERQTLHRLPRTRALVFAFKTYLYPLADFKAESNGAENTSHTEEKNTSDNAEREFEDQSTAEQLAQAIEGLSEGNAPGIAFYKRRPVWGGDVVGFLRG